MMRRASLTTVLCLALGAGSAARAETRGSQAAQKRAVIASHGSGTFDVKVKPLPNDEKVGGLTVARMSLDKQFKGELEGTSKGEMTTAETSVQGSGGYVAIERVTGTLRSRSGTFVLLHQGTMKRGGDFRLSIVVVPDESDYTLPEAP
jgi:hypothetical protein